MEIFGPRFWASGIFLSGLFSATFLFGQVGDPLSGQSYRLRLAEAWAPMAFHDTAVEFTEPETGFNPVDSLVGLFFDANRDVRDNAQNIFQLGVQEMEQVLAAAPVYFSVAETKSHIYIQYIFYHAIDVGPEGHVHDTENLWTVIEKDGSPFGRLVMHITNAHGFGMIYGPDSLEETNWRSAVNYGQVRGILEYLDRHSKKHHEEGEPEYVKRADSASFKVFIASKSHAIYKFSHEAWSETENKGGTIYVPARCQECLAEALQYRNPIRTYVLEDWDSLMESALVRARIDEVGKGEFLKLFTPPTVDSNNHPPNYKPRKLPEFLAPGVQELSPKANIFYTTSMKSPYDLNDPVRVHRFFSHRQQLSDEYIFNAYLDDAKSTPMDPRFVRWVTPLRKASLFRMVSELWEAQPN